MYYHYQSENNTGDDVKVKEERKLSRPRGWSSQQRENWFHVFGMAVLIDQVNEFDHSNGDWIIYNERLEQYFCANSITDARIKVATL